ncbi:hypothetical protein [Shewanella aquimarina]|uniref:hypothetical protein n=1 Tax=Shewanella aquimarina TaxID=260365 RepID=UPI002014C559|nr:hypothetical protein [Shewanella aquimarina]MCL2912074.1 hypothetical protein [Shewanella aquimarina]
MLGIFNKGEGNKMRAGLGLLFVLLLGLTLAKGGYLYLKDIALTKPFFTFTNPAWGLWLILLFGVRPSVNLLVSVIMLFSLPLYAACLLFVGYWPVVTYLIGGQVPSLFELSNWLLSIAYGPLAAQMDYFTIANRLAQFADLRYFIMLVTLSGGLAMAVILPMAHLPLAGGLANRRGLDLDAGAETPIWLSLFGRLLLGILFYNVAYPLLAFASILPLGLNYLAVWTVLLTPILGFGLALINWHRPHDEKLGAGLIRYFSLALLALLAGYIWHNFDDLFGALLKVTQGDLTQALVFLFLLTGLFVLFMLASLVRAGEGSKS